jgi:L-ascorbate metabolism protein UlaG (beta-lactamase superfamily)
MDIEYKGANCVILKNKNDTVVVDPTENVSVKDFGENAIILSTDEKNKISGQSGFLISAPGEYEKGDVSVKGVQIARHIDPVEYGKQGVAYRVEFAGVRVAILGHISAPISDDDLEKIGVVDVVVIPVGGGGYTLDSKDAAAIIRQIEPRVVIPTHYDDGTKYEVPQEKIETFKNEFSGAFENREKSVSIKNIEMLPEGPAVWVIEKS